MRLLHTSDWHLGHVLRDISREREHAAFLGWLIDTVVAERCDAVLITGDVYDSSIPTAAAEKLWFDFLARMPALPIVAIAGNHDSPSRLAASSELCRARGIHVVTAFDAERCAIDIGGAIV